MKSGMKSKKGAKQGSLITLTVSMDDNVVEGMKESSNTRTGDIVDDSGM